MLKSRPLWLVMGIAIGVAGSFVGTVLWERLMGAVTIEGILQYEPPPDPALTATYPTGHFVGTRVYLDDAPPAAVGKPIYARGAIGGTPLGATPRYPMLMPASLTISEPSDPPAR